jgi:myosin heavy chain 9/10/11/14
VGGKEKREARDNVLCLPRELDEQYEKNDDLETKRKALQSELDELANTQVSKWLSVCFFAES